MDTKIPHVPRKDAGFGQERGVGVSRQLQESICAQSQVEAPPKASPSDLQSVGLREALHPPSFCGKPLALLEKLMKTCQVLLADTSPSPGSSALPTPSGALSSAPDLWDLPPKLSFKSTVSARDFAHNLIQNRTLPLGHRKPLVCKLWTPLREDFPPAPQVLWLPNSALCLRVKPHPSSSSCRSAGVKVFLLEEKQTKGD